MKKITATDTLELSIPERIQLVEDIWDTIAAEAQSIVRPEAEDDLKSVSDLILDFFYKLVRPGDIDFTFSLSRY
jgi:hypothetical protein